MKILAIIPVSGSDPEYQNGQVPMLGSKSVLDWTLDAVKESRLIDRAIVATDSELIAEATRRAGMEEPYLRDITDRTLGLGELFSSVVHNLRITENYEPDWVVQLWVNYPFRQQGLLDRSIKSAVSADLDSAFLAYPEFSTYWYVGLDSKPTYITTDSSVPRNQRPPIYRDLRGLFSICRTFLVDQKTIIGGRVFIIPVRYFGCDINLHDIHERRYAELIASHIDLTLAEEGEGEKAGEPIAPRIYHRETKPLVLKQDILKETLIQAEHLEVGKSDIGISEDLLPEIVGQYVSAYDLKKGEPLTFGVMQWISR